MDLNYTWIQWLFFFYFYCFFGWCFESVYVSIKEKKPINRGFMRGPFLPLYGTGALMMLIVSAPFWENLILTYIAGCIGATVLEYVTGVVMEALFRIRYWDYSDQPFNFQGYICLGSSLAWGGLTILMTRLVHQPVANLVLAIPEGILTAVTMALSLVAVADFTLSFKAALDLRDVLVYMEEAKKEMQRLQKRMDAMVALAGQHREERKLDIEARMEELTEQMEIKAGEVKKELSELRERFRFQQERYFGPSHKRNFQFKAILKGNPTLRSERFKEALEELKEAMEERRGA